MPKHPVYVSMLPETARQVIGLPHPTGRAAMRMLEEEGFHAEGYVDIFDGGPTMTARTDRVRSIAGARTATITHVRAPEGGGAHARALIATGRLSDFRCAYGEIAPDGEAGVVLDPVAAQSLDVSVGDTVWHVAR